MIYIDQENQSQHNKMTVNNTRSSLPLACLKITTPALPSTIQRKSDCDYHIHICDVGPIAQSGKHVNCSRYLKGPVSQFYDHQISSQRPIEYNVLYQVGSRSLHLLDVVIGKEALSAMYFTQPPPTVFLLHQVDYITWKITYGKSLNIH